MSHTITIRLSKELARLLEQVAARTGGHARSFMRLAGAVRGPRDLSRRKGFARS